MTLRKSLILFNGLIAAVVSVLLLWNVHSLRTVATVPHSVDLKPLPDVQRQPPSRQDVLKNVFGLKKPDPPPPAITQSPPGPAQEVHAPKHILRLEGIIVTGSKRLAVVLAYLKDNPKKIPPERKKVQMGDMLFDFKVQEISKDRILLYQSTSNQVVPLVIFKANTTEG